MSPPYFFKKMLLIEASQLINHEGMVQHCHFAILNEIMYLGIDHGPKSIRLIAEMKLNNESFRLTTSEPTGQF